MTCEVKIIENSVTLGGSQLITFQLRYWRAIHGELMTHRVFSRNASSSRAIPVMTMLKQVWNDPAGPIHWGANQAGMQAHAELEGLNLAVAKGIWKWSGRAMCVAAWSMTKLGLHKQVANRMLEPWQYINVVLTASDFDNWYELRDHKDAQPEIQELARAMRLVSFNSSPKVLETGEWHLPYVTALEREEYKIEDLLMFSVARCARVSYLTHDRKDPQWDKDIELYFRLVGSRPWHASPLEHQATPVTEEIAGYSGNFNHSWTQYRKLFEAGLSV